MHNFLMNLKLKNYNVYIIQDAHFTTREKKSYRNNLRLYGLFISYRSNSRGNAILFNDNCEVKVNNKYKDKSGKYLF